MININNMPHSSIIRSLYEDYYAKEMPSNEYTSSLWKDCERHIEVSIDSDGSVRKLRGYGFGGLENTHCINKMVHYLCNLTYYLRLPDKKEIRRLVKAAVKALEAMDSYLSYECFRQLYSFNSICKHLNAAPDEEFNVLIIGDGYGFLSAMIKSVYPKSRITLVDIGKVLFFQAFNLQRIFPDAVHAVVLKGISIEPQPDFIYCPTENLERLARRKFKLIVNSTSMQEMNFHTIERYFNYIRRNAVADNFFYCCNRSLKVLPCGEAIEFLKYPWRPKDKHIVDERCNFYKYFFTWRPPFIRYYDGPFRHRLTKMSTEDDTEKSCAVLPRGKAV